MTISQRTDPRFNGMNGDIMLNTVPEGIPAGRMSGEGWGYKKDLPVLVEIRMERLLRRETYETIEHEQVVAPLDFSIVTAAWSPGMKDWVVGGAGVDRLRELTSVNTSYFTQEQIDGLIALDEWHLNGLTAGCAHQEVVWEDSEYGRRPSLSETPACPITGYRYGHSWLVRPLPKGFVSNLLALLDDAIDDRRVYVNPSLSTLEV